MAELGNRMVLALDYGTTYTGTSSVVESNVLPNPDLEARNMDIILTECRFGIWLGRRRQQLKSRRRGGR